MTFKRTIILLADGSRPDIFAELLAAGELPNISNDIVARGTFTRAVSTFPSTTGPAHMPFLTGALPATLNVPGIRWFDRHLYAKHGHGSMLTFGAHGRYRSYVGLETFRINSDMKPDVKNVFEILPKSYCIFNSINRGVGSRNLTRIMRIWYWYYGHLTDRWRFIDEVARRKTLSAVDRDFDFLFTVIPGIDEYGHLADPRHEYALGQYRFLDKFVGDLTAKLKGTGRFDDTLLWIVSDHGLSSTHTHFCINNFLESRGIKTFYYPLIYRKGFSAVSMVSGNGMSHVYFKRPDGWDKGATFGDIEAMYPRLLNDFLREKAVDVIAGRHIDGSIIVRTKRGEARLRLIDGNILYTANGSDPFGYELAPVGKTVSMNERDFLRATFDSDYPDAPYQLAHIFQSSRCGDLVVSAAPGYDLRLKFEHPEHHGSHGGLHREHMMVPLFCSAPLGDSKAVRTVDVFPTYMKLMGKPVPENIDGVELI